MVLTLDTLKGRVYTVEEVAALMGITPDAVRRRIRLGYLPARSVPGAKSMVISGDDLAVYLSGAPVTARKRRGRAITKATPVSSNPEPLAKPEGPSLPFNGGDAPKSARLASVPAPSVAIPFKLPDGSVSRLRSWMDSTGKSNKALEREAGVNASSLSYILNGKRSLCRDNAIRLRDAYGESLLLYLMGDAPMPGDP